MAIIAVVWTAIFAVTLTRWRLRRWLVRRLMRRSRVWRVRVRANLRLGARGRRLRLYGIVPFADPAVLRAADAMLRAAIDGRRVRLRVLGQDGDGTLVVTVRCGGANPALALLRAGVVSTPVTVARAYREALSWARCAGRGNWRTVDKWPPGFVGWHVERMANHKYRYG